MCGICGFTGLHDSQLLRKMCGLMVHRGPDSVGYFEDETVSLGVRRLKIIDLQTGDQPLHNEDSTMWVVFNGEIYNFLELRRELKVRGHDFYTLTDGEVLVHLYEEYGDELVSRLRGMFAFALWDTTRKRLILARDRFGKKPLYYTSFRGSMFFASELKALLALKELPRTVNLDAVAHYLTYLYNPLQESFVKSVYRLPPASILIWEVANAQTRVSEYWDLPTQSIELTEEEAISTLGRLLEDAVRIRLKSDVPLGVLLSGGVDSSIVAAIASRYQEGINTFSIGFSETDNEFRHSQEVAEKFETDYHQYYAHPDFPKLLPEIVGMLDEPLGDSSIVPTYLISYEARRHVTVCLTGDGGDELFWGYPWLKRDDSLESWFKLPRLIRRPALEVIERLPTRYAEEARDLKRYERLNYSGLDERTKCIARLSHMTESEVGQALSGNYSTFATFDQIGRRGQPSDRSSAYLTVKTILPNDYLHKGDRLSMANSLELRAPLLDHLLAENVWMWPSKLKISGGQSKCLLKLFAYRELQIPKNVIYREKRGFSIPYEGWFKEIKSELKNSSHNLRGIVSRETILKALDSDISYQDAQNVFALHVLALWLDYLQNE